MQLLLIRRMKLDIIGSKTPHYNKLRALMNMYEGKLIMYACIIRETFVFTVFRRVFHSILKLELCRHACRRRDQIIPTCGYGKNMPTTALVITSWYLGLRKKEKNLGFCWGLFIILAWGATKKKKRKKKCALGFLQRPTDTVFYFRRYLKLHSEDHDSST